tara:strand:+ start:1102 stop:1242 length:141 start_codon:yes stop_codon:yes gene_type:complete
LQFKKLLGENMKDMIKNKKVWIGIVIVVIAVAWFMWSGQPAPEVTQ